MTPLLLHEFEGVLALPSAEASVDHRLVEGLIWNPQRDELVSESLPNFQTFPPTDALSFDQDAIAVEARRAWAEAEMVEAPVIFGGSLTRHFGHFLHESLSRLWWLAPLAGIDGSALEATRRLQEVEGDVVFFMPRWLDRGKDLLPYMQEIFALLGLPISRIKILQRPLRFQRILIPASVWGFDADARVIDQCLGCDSRALMRHLFASCTVPAALPLEVEPVPTDKVFVSRSGLPINLGRLIGDVVLDPLLEASGYRVFHPERSPIAEQIHVYSQAHDLVFVDGSSLYMLWFAKLRPGTRVRVILRRRQGRWMCQKVRDLLPAADHLRWELVDALEGEGLTSDKDWESHNVADLASVLRQLGIEAPSLLPKAAEEALAAYCQTLQEQSSPEQLARVLQALLTSLVTEPARPASRRRRLYRKIRGLWPPRLTSL